MMYVHQTLLSEWIAKQSRELVERKRTKKPQSGETVCGRKKFTWHKYHLLEDQATGSVSTQCLATGPINWSIGLTLISTFSCKELAYSDPPMAISTHESVKRW